MSKATCRLLATIMSVWLCSIPGWSTVQESNKANSIGEKQLPKPKMNTPQANEIKFNCNNAQHLTLSNFLAGLDPDKASTIRVSGTCTDNLHITGINRLTLLAAPGATINDASGGNDFVVSAANTLTFDFEGFTINGGGAGFGCLNHSTCLLAGNTIQNSLGGPGVIVNRSNAILQGDTIQNNAGRGVSALNAANVTLAGETVQNNGGAGVAVFYGTNLNVQFSVITSNHGVGGIRVVDHSTLRLIDSTIQGNPNGVSLESSSEGTFENFGAGSTITGNAGAGVLVQDQAFGNFSNGPNTITGNLGGKDVVCEGQFPVTLSALTLIGDGTTNCPN